VTLTRSRRAMAGSRLNKHHPVARFVRRSDCAIERRETDYAGWYEAGLYASESPERGLFFALAALDHDPAQGSKPNHATRAVSIDACFGGRLPDRDSAKTEAAHRAGDCGRFAAPTTALARREAYRRQDGRYRATPKQFRRLWKKANSIGEYIPGMLSALDEMACAS
jgi:hypothetical protein